MIEKDIDAIAASLKECSFIGEENTINQLTKKTYKAILLLLMEKLAYDIIVTGDAIRMPVRLGTFQAVKFKTPKFFPIDYATSDKLGKLIRHKNRQTQGYWTRIHWYKAPVKESIMKSRGGALFKYMRSYSFSFSRPNLRPNSYNKWNPKASLYPFFKDKGWLLYKERNSYDSKFQS